MARMKTISALEAEISKVNEELAKIQQKEEALLNKLTKLQEKKQQVEATQMLEK